MMLMQTPELVRWTLEAHGCCWLLLAATVAADTQLVAELLMGLPQKRYPECVTAADCLHLNCNGRDCPAGVLHRWPGSVKMQAQETKWTGDWHPQGHL